MQCKDIPDEPVLRFIASHSPATWWKIGDEMPPNSVLHAMPDGTPEKLARVKMGNLIRRGLSSGCACGCRGDFRITKGGTEILNAD